MIAAASIRRTLSLASSQNRLVSRPSAISCKPVASRTYTKYTEKVHDYFERPRNVGKLDASAPNVGTGLVGAPACGDVMRLQIKVDDNGIITDAVFKTFGCGSAIASSSLATEWVKGKTLDEGLEIKNTDIAKYLALPPVKLHCSMLAESAIKAAVKDLKTKREQKSAGSVSSAASSQPSQQPAAH